MTIKPFPRFLRTGMPLILVLGSLQPLANADKESEVESIFLKLESDARAFRDKIMQAYGARCEANTVKECYQGNFKDCDSKFPNQVCPRAEELVVPNCGDGKSALWDKTVSKVSIPGLWKTGEAPSDSTINETVCYSRLAEPFMVEKYKADEEYWELYDVRPSSSYFGAHNGLFRMIPAIHRCEDYDPRRRPWFVAASSGPKDVVLVLDVSESMTNYYRMQNTKDAAITVIQTLTVADRLAVISFSNETSQVGGYTGLIRATPENRNHLVEAIEQLRPQGTTNFGIAFTSAFDVLDQTIQNEATTGCNIAIIFMTDGGITDGPGPDDVISLVNERTEQLASNYGRKTAIFTYSLGKDADHNVTKAIACSTGGIWTLVPDIYDDGDLISAMSAYYKLFALGLGVNENEDFVAWVEPYEFATGGMIGTTVSVPVYDRNVTPYLFLGVVGIDIYMSAIERILGEEATSSIMLERFVARSTASCPKIELSACELDALRFLSGGEDATCGVCNSTNYSGIVPETCPSQNYLPNDLLDNSDMAGKEYCCEVGPIPKPEPIPKPDNSALIIGISVSASVIVVLIMGLFLSHKLKKPNPMVNVSVIPVPVPDGESNVSVLPVPVPDGESNVSVIPVPVPDGKSNVIYPYHLAVAPPPPVNPQFVDQDRVRDS